MNDQVAVPRELLERLEAVLRYEPETGAFFWKQNRYASRVGKPAGGISDLGYLKITVDGKRYMAHRLAWLIVHGVFPPEHMDHIDGDRANNRIGNLRPCTAGENRQNAISSIKTGSSWNKNKHKWQATIMINRKSKHLGYFNSMEEAHAAYCKAKSEMHTFNQTPRYTGYVSKEAQC